MLDIFARLSLLARRWATAKALAKLNAAISWAIQARLAIYRWNVLREDREAVRP